MRIGILGTGTMAEALGTGWVRAGHAVVVGGRSPGRAQALADRMGGGTRAAAPREVVAGRDAVLLAVTWSGVGDVLRSAGAARGALAGTPLIDPTNAVDHGVGVGVVHTGPGGSGARAVAALAPGAHVVKAFHMFPAAQWTRPAEDPPVTVAMAGDDAGALRVTGELVRALGAAPAVLGPLERARQLEEAAGFVIGLASRGIDPATAVPHVPAA